MSVQWFWCSRCYIWTSKSRKTTVYDWQIFSIIRYYIRWKQVSFIKAWIVLCSSWEEILNINCSMKKKILNVQKHIIGGTILTYIQWNVYLKLYQIYILYHVHFRPYSGIHLSYLFKTFLKVVVTVSKNFKFKSKI